MIVIPADQHRVDAKYEVDNASFSFTHGELFYFTRSITNAEPDFRIFHRINTNVPFNSRLLPLKVIR